MPAECGEESEALAPEALAAEEETGREARWKTASIKA